VLLAWSKLDPFDSCHGNTAQVPVPKLAKFRARDSPQLEHAFSFCASKILACSAGDNVLRAGGAAAFRSDDMARSTIPHPAASFEVCRTGRNSFS
jgi:hypothetical protein